MQQQVTVGHQVGLGFDGDGSTRVQHQMTRTADADLAGATEGLHTTEPIGPVHQRINKTDRDRTLAGQKHIATQPAGRDADTFHQQLQRIGRRAQCTLHIQAQFVGGHTQFATAQWCEGGIGHQPQFVGNQRSRVDRTAGADAQVAVSGHDVVALGHHHMAGTGVDVDRATLAGLHRDAIGELNVSTGL